jgi:hypothetical protein
MNGSAEIRRPYYDHQLSPWGRAVLMVVVAAALVVWATLALTIGYTHVGFSKLMSVSRRKTQRILKAL